MHMISHGLHCGIVLRMDVFLYYDIKDKIHSKIVISSLENLI